MNLSPNGDDENRSVRRRLFSPPNKDESATSMIDQIKNEIKRLETVKSDDEKALIKLREMKIEDRHTFTQHMDTPQQEGLKRKLAKRVETNAKEIEKRKKDIERLKTIAADKVIATTPDNNNRQNEQSENNLIPERQIDDKQLENAENRKEPNIRNLLRTRRSPKLPNKNIPGEFKEIFSALRSELKAIRRNEREINDSLHGIKKIFEKECLYFHVLERKDRSKLQKLEDRLNEFSNSSQSEMRHLNQRLDQLVESFNTDMVDLKFQHSNLQDMIEAAQYQFIKIEHRIGPQTQVHDLFLGLANVVVEFMKFFMFILSSLTSILMNICGDRQRASAVLLVLLVASILWIYFSHFSL